MRRLSRLTAVLLLLAGARAGAQNTPAAAPAGDERAAVLATVRRLFDGMRAGDSATVRGVFHAQAQLASAVAPGGKPDVRIDSLSSFVKAVGMPHTETWDERTRNEVVHVDGTLATVWAEYTFYAGSRLSHCGVDAFMLARTAAGWRIVSLVDTRRREGCAEIPPAR